MKLGIVCGVTVLAGLMATSAFANDIHLKRGLASAQAYAQDRDGAPVATVTQDRFPLKLLEESPDGGRYRVKYDGRDVWLSKDEVKASSSIDAGSMCSTALASSKNAATRNANGGCTTSASAAGTTRR